MRRTKKDKVIDAIFLIAMSLCVIILLVDVHIGRSAAEAAHELPTGATTGETTEVMTEATETEVPTEPSTEPTEAEPPTVLYNVPLATELQLHIISEAEAHGIDPAIVFAIAQRESTYNTSAIGDGGDSLGLLQVQPYWHSGRMEKLGCTDLLDPYQNVIVGIDYLCEMLNRYGSMEAALTAYNKGHYPGYVTEYAYDVMAKAEGLRGDLA